MNITQNVKVGVLAVLMLLTALAIVYAQTVFSAPAIRDENNIPAVFGSSCDSATVTKVVIGHQVSTTIQATTTRRAYTRIQQPLNATNTVSIALNNDAAVSGNGIVLPPATTTNMATLAEFGLTTPFPYTGPITAITSTGSSTITVTTCTY